MKTISTITPCELRSLISSLTASIEMLYRTNPNEPSIKAIRDLRDIANYKLRKALWTESTT